MKIGKGTKLFVGISLIVVSLLILIGLVKFGSLFAFFMIYPYVISEIIGMGINPYLSKIIAFLVAIAILFVIKYVFSWRAEKRNIGYAILAGLFIVHSLTMFFITRDRFFGFQGEPLKYCCRDSISNELICEDAPGYCQDGTQRHSITAEEVVELKARESSDKYNLKSATMEIPCWEVKNWFNAKNGQVLIYYEENPANNFHCYAGAGFSPITGRELKPVNAEVINRIKKFAAVQKAYYDSQQLKDDGVSVPDRVSEIVENAADGGANIASSIVNYFRSNPSAIFILLIIINILPWIWIIFYDRFAVKIFDSNKPTLPLLIIVSVIILNIIFFPAGKIFGNGWFIAWLITIIAFVLFVIAWIVEHIISSHKTNSDVSSGKSTRDEEYRRRRQEYERRRQAFLNGSG